MRHDTAAGTIAGVLVAAALGFSGCASNCSVDPQGCTSDEDCRYGRICHDERHFCVAPGEGARGDAGDGSSGDSSDTDPIRLRR